MESLITECLDLFGVAVCALTGAVKAAQHKLDLFGILFMACCVGVGGGIIRDCIIGSLPVAALQNQSYILIALVTGLVTVVTMRFWQRFDSIVQIGDAVALGVFTALGAAKASQLGIAEVGIILSGMFTGIGGGVIRDVLTGTVPAVLKYDIYATASMIGAVLFCFLKLTTLPFFVIFLIVSSTVTSIRLWAMIYKVNLPKDFIDNADK